MQVEFHLIHVIAKIQLKILFFKPTEKFVNKPKEIKPLCIRLKDDLDKLKINTDNILQNDDEDDPTWTYNSPKINTSLLNIKSHQIHLNISKRSF
jgi:hypothetical protein